MIRKYVKVVLILVILGLAICENGLTPPKEDSKTQIFTLPPKRQDGKVSITASLSKDFYIKIRGNVTTGYGWFCDNKDDIIKDGVINPLNLKENSDAEYYTDPHERGMTGVGGSYFFHFKPLKVGDTKVIFVNKRPWDTHDQVSVEVILSVSNN